MSILISIISLAVSLYALWLVKGLKVKVAELKCAKSDVMDKAEDDIPTGKKKKDEPRFFG